MAIDDEAAAYLWDMHDACREMLELAGDAEWEDFIADRKLCLAVERCLEIVGEAAGRLSEDFRVAHPEISWHKIRGMRNILAHEYGEIDYEVIFKTVNESIPDLMKTLEGLLPPE